MSIDLTKFNDRSNEGWAHPDVMPFYAAINAPNPAMGLAFDPTTPWEQRKAAINEADKAFKETMGAGVEQMATRYEVAGKDGNVIETFVAKPASMTESEKKPCFFYVPGGGLTTVAITFMDFAKAEKYDAVMVAMRYRCIYDFKEGQAGYPGTVDDVEAVYKWTVEHADELGIDPDRIVIWGTSSGAHLGLALAHRLKKANYYSYMPRGIVVYGPIVDERQVFPTSNISGISWTGWSMHNDLVAWMGFDEDACATAPADAIANHASIEECVGLPPTFLHVEENDADAGPVMEYAAKLMGAGVFTEVHVWGGAAHANLGTIPFMDAENVYAQRFDDIISANIRDCMNYDLRRQFLK